MIQEDSIFGAEPDDLKRLVRFGLEPDDTAIDENNSRPTASVDELMERPGARIGRYKLLRVLGEGGMGVVYLAQQDKPVTRQVALKVIKPGMDSKRVMARFEVEEQALALMEHPHVARVYDAGLTGSGRPYFVMEYVQGIPITEHCDKYKLTVEQRLRLFLHVCEGVQHAHQKGIIHRDIKPSNILISMENGRAIPKIIDFGVAKALSQPLTERTLFTEQGQLFGTPEYMSPEQADMASEDIDTRSDIYSLGVLLYVLLTGVMPFDPKTFREGGVDHIRQVIRETDPKTPSTRLSSLGEEANRIAEDRRTRVAALAKCLHRELEWIPLKAMHKERQERYRSASELADDIENYLKGAPLIAGPPSTVYRIKKFARRNRALVTGVTAVITVLIAGVVVSTMFAVKADQRRVEAQAVSDFLRNSVLALIDPYQTATEEITRRSLLDAISENLEQDFTGPPLAEAQIRQTLGFAYWSIGAYPLAASHFEQAIEVCQVHLGPEHPTTLEWKENLGWTYMHQSRYREAEPLLKKTLEGTRRVLGDEHMQTASSMWSLAALYWSQGLYEEAEPLLDRALEISTRQGGQEDRLTVAIMNQMAWVYWSQGRYKAAEQLSSKALAINLEERGPQDNWTLALKFQLGAILWTLGRYEQAERYMREALDDGRSVFGDENVHTLWAMCGMGVVCNSQGRYEEAESALNEALTTAQRVFGNTHDVTAFSLHRLGTVYLSQERYEEAEPLLENALKTMSSLLGEDHPWTLDIISDFGVLRYQQQRYDEAESLLREALDRRQRKLGDDHPAYFESMHELAMLYKAQGDYDDAEPLLREAVKSRLLKLGEKHPHTIESLNNLIELYEAWNKPEKAKEWRTKLQQTEVNTE
jgi:serine/threonine protein kinase/Tfp pilus assembly protein PilF